MPRLSKFQREIIKIVKKDSTKANSLLLVLVKFNRVLSCLFVAISKQW